MSVIVNMTLMLVLTLGIVVRSVRMPHLRMVVLVHVHRRQMFHAGRVPAGYVVRNVQMLMSMHHVFMVMLRESAVSHFATASLPRELRYAVHLSVRPGSGSRREHKRSDCGG
jgi:hypothetical protein